MKLAKQVRANLRTVVVGFAAVSVVLGNVVSVRAATLTSSSLTLSDPRTSQTGVNYTFQASGYTTATTLRCIDLRLNTAADGSGSAVTGITTTGASLTSSSVITAGSWTADVSTNGRLRLTNAAGQTPNASGNFVWGSITNGSTEGTTYYGVLNTYSDAGCTTGVDSKSVAFVYRDGELVELTIDPSLTFTTAAVAASQTVNGATTTDASSGTGINYGNDVTTSANGVSAHDLQVATNASSGYVVYLRQSGNFQNGASDVINPHTGTNASPSAFSAAGTESWGYTTEDSSLTGGTANRFTGGNWAGLATTNEPVVDNTTATAGTVTTRVGHQVGIASNTPAGTYQTTLIYTIVATY